VSAQWHLGTVKMPMHPVEMHAQLAALHRVGRMRETDIVDAILYPESNSFVTGKSFTSTAGRALAIDAKPDQWSSERMLAGKDSSRI
jgi:hypothetical protein